MYTDSSKKSELLENPPLSELPDCTSKARSYDMMRKLLIFCLVFFAAFGRLMCSTPAAAMIFDFAQLNNLDGWMEQSDPVRSVGMSKATLTLQRTEIFQRAVFFALLNPQPNGAGFAGVRRIAKLNLSAYSGLMLKCRSQGVFNGFKIVLRHKGLNDEPNISFEQMFEGPRGGFETVELPFAGFKPYYRGKVVNTTEVLDTSSVTMFGLQFYGGVYMPVKQSGPATLEIDWIKAME